MAGQHRRQRCAVERSFGAPSLAQHLLFTSSLAEKIPGELITFLFTKLVAWAVTFFPCKELRREEQLSWSC